MDGKPADNGSELQSDYLLTYLLGPFKGQQLTDNKCLNAYFLYVYQIVSTSTLLQLTISPIHLSIHTSYHQSCSSYFTRFGF